MLQRAYPQQGVPEGLARNGSSRAGSSWLRGRSGSGAGGDGSALDDGSSVLSLDLAGEAVGADTGWQGGQGEGAMQSLAAEGAGLGCKRRGAVCTRANPVVTGMPSCAS